MANGITISRSSDIFQVYLVDEEGQSTLGIDDGTKRQSLRVEIVNTSSQVISFKALNLDENLSTNYHFCISFRLGTLINQGKDMTLTVQDGQSQPIEIESKWAEQEEVLFLKLKDIKEILPSQRLTVVLGNIGAAPAGGARGTRVEIRLSNFQYVKSSQDNTKSFEDVPNQTRLQYLNIVNQRGKKRIPLYAGFFGSNTILNDGTENELTLSIQCLPIQNVPLRIEPYSSGSFDNLQDVESDKKTSLGKTVIELLQEQIEFKDFIKNIASNAITQGMQGGIKLPNIISNDLNSIATDVTNKLQIFIEELIDDNWINDLLDGQKSIKKLIESSQSIQNSFVTKIFANSSIDQFIAQDSPISEKVKFLNSILPDEITNLNLFNKLISEGNTDKKQEIASALLTSVTSTGIISEADLKVILARLGELKFTSEEKVLEVLEKSNIIRLDNVEVAETGVLNFKGIGSDVTFDQETANTALDESVTIRISFDVATQKEDSKKGSENWALVERNNADAIQISIAQGQDNWIFGGKFDEGITPQWSFVCKRPLELKKREEIIRLSITNLKTQLLSGYANLYVHYQNFPGYWDGFITVPIHKGPLVFRECEDTNKNRIGCVGIGTDEPKAKLHIKSSTDVVGLKVEGDTEMEKLGIGTTNLGDNQLTVQGNTAFFGELKITLPDETVYISPEGYYDETSGEQVYEKNITKPFFIAGIESDSAFLKLRSRVWYGNDNDQWEFKAQKNDSDFSKLYISNPSSANPHKLVIDNNGVGIGTTNLADNRLTVQGNTAIAGNLSVTNGKVGIGVESGAEQLKVQGNTAIAGKLTVTNDLFAGKTEIVSSSDHLVLKRRTAETEGGAKIFLELVQETSNGGEEVRPCIRFHHGNRFWNRVEAGSDGFHFRTGSIVSGEYVRVNTGDMTVNGSLRVTNVPYGDKKNLQWDENSKQFFQDNSSRKNKENITCLEDDFFRIMQVEPKTYTRPGNPNVWEIGYIAEEFDELGLNKLVYYEADDSPGAIHYDKISIYLIEVVKQLCQKMNDYEQRINQLEKTDS